jgi:acyl transferase domain-containing protein
MACACVRLPWRHQGVYLGLSTRDYEGILAADVHKADSIYAATGCTFSVAFGRAAFVLGLHGPCISCDTACSAALVACHGGVRAIQLNEAVNSVVLGVNLMLSPVLTGQFARAGMTSMVGRSHTFDRRADGYARGEGCCASTLSPSGALHASVCGVAVRQDGRSARLDCTKWASAAWIAPGCS